MRFKYKNSIPKVKCNEEVSTGFLVSDDKVITTIHSIKEYLSDNTNLIETIFQDKNGKKFTRHATPILPSNGEIDDFEIIALQLNETVGDTNSLECIKYCFEDQVDVFTYGYPAVRENEGTLIELKLLGDNGYLDLKVNSDSIKDYQGCSGGPIIYKNFVVGVMLEQVAENGEASRIGAVSLMKYEQYFKEIGLALFEKASDIYRFEEFLMGCTNPKISLDFFNYEENDFEEDFFRMLSTQSTIYLQGKTKEEVMGYILYIIKTKSRHLIPKVLIVEDLEEWNKLKESFEDKILIPNFNANEITSIPKNVSIILYGEEDFVSNKKPLKLNKRTLDNMRDKLTDEIGDATIAHQLVRQCNGLYSIFKRKVFEGKNGKPRWEEYTDLNLLPALLASSWKNNSKDKLFIERLINISYNEYIDSIKDVTNGEDPFILHYNTGYEDVFKLANIEESWEILFSEITKDKLQLFEDLVLEVFSEIPAKFDLPIEEHYRSRLLTDEDSEYSSSLKGGIIRSLIALALKENANTFDTQRYVDNIIERLFLQTQNSKQWFAIAEFLPLISEASPFIFVDFLEKEVNNPESKLWDLFESKSDGFFARNYYTHVIWSLEKLLCLENLAPRSIKILVKLAERDLSYKISNSPLSTLGQALSGWLHVINVSLDEKIDLVEYIVETSSIGWLILERILPDRSNHGSFLSMTRLDYRPYEFKYKLEYRDQLFKTYKAYTSIAINTANNDLEKWGVLFDKCTFIELELYDLAREKLVQALFNNEIDEVRYTFKEKLRDIIYRHRFFKDSDWALSEVNVKKIEELFNLITFKCVTYNYLYLFTNEKLVELNPTPYDRNERTDWDKQNEKLKEERIKALNLIIENPKDSIWNLVKLLRVHDTTGRSQQVIGNILASDIYNYNLDFEFLNEALANSAEILFISYVEKVYSKEGIKIIEYVLNYLKENDEMVLPILKIAHVDEKVLELLSAYTEELQDKYWTDFVIYWDIVDNRVKEEVWLKLLKYKNFNALLRMIDLYFQKDLEKNLIILEAILSNQEVFTINSQNSYLIIEVFENIYRESNLNIERNLYLRICHLEWEYFSLLIDQLPPKYLMEELKTDPKLLASLIQAAYKSSKEEKDIDEVKIRLGKQAWEILFKLKFCPCVDENNDISEEKLEIWVKIFLDEIDKNGHEIIGRQILGECFAYSPRNDEIFPHIAVCKVFEKYYTEDIGKGFVLGIYNSRGIYQGTNGRKEEALAAQYENYARKVRIRYPKVSTQLLKISEDYKRQAFQERERASYDL
ncbi:hypothetical protein C2I06_21230 [Niallia circulans]|uniref:hypothetical protein n=1 Tax=Niallia circulans TaxID=1397 RepID=UPI000F45288D|nr:hypothetical protein [Niallia circulans]AYV69164.1 hypothetical protein C2I06_21230 [Niallia circulans]